MLLLNYFDSPPPHTSLERGCSPFFNKFEYPSPKDALIQMQVLLEFGTDSGRKVIRKAHLSVLLN